MVKHLAFCAIVAFFLLVLACIFNKGDVRAGFKTLGSEVFIEAKERTKPAPLVLGEQPSKAVPIKP